MINSLKEICEKLDKIFGIIAVQNVDNNMTKYTC